MMPSLDVLQDIALHLPKLKHSVRLATNLGLGEEFVERVKAHGFADDVVVLKVLFKWREKRSVEATGKVLFNALVATSRDIALYFADCLLGEGKEDPKGSS